MAQDKVQHDERREDGKPNGIDPRRQPVLGLLHPESLNSER